MKIRQITLPVAVVAVSAIGFMTPASASSETSSGITEKSYVEFLESSNDVGANEALSAFNAADEDVQDDYIENLNDPNFIEAMFSGDPEMMSDYGLSQSVETAPAPQARAAAASGQHSNTYVHKMSWGPIPTLNVSQTYNFTGNGSTVTSSDSCSAMHTAYVPIANITENTTHQTKNGDGYCRTEWSAKFLNDPTWNFSSVQDQQVNGDGSIVFENFYDI